MSNIISSCIPSWKPGPGRSGRKAIDSCHAHDSYKAVQPIWNPWSLLLKHSALSCLAGAYTGGGGGGGSPLPMNPPRSFKFRFKTNGMRAHCVRAHFRDRSRPAAVFHRMRMRSSFNFKDLIVAERARPCSSGRRADCAVSALSGRIILVQNVEHSLCSKRRHEEEKSFNGHSFLPAPAKRGASSAEPPFFLIAWHTGKESVKGTLLPRLINIVVVRRQEDVGLLRTDRPPLTLSWSSGLHILS